MMRVTVAVLYTLVGWGCVTLMCDMCDMPTGTLAGQLICFVSAQM